MHQNPHQPVLLAAVLQLLDPQPGRAYFDGTAGYGGHAAAILDRLGDHGRAVLVDRDEQAAQYLRQHCSQAEVRQMTYAAAARQLLADGQRFDLALLDLGVSTPQLAEAERGFSFNSDGPLDMRMDQTQTLTAERVVNTYSFERLRRLLREYGQEPRATAIARAIEAARPFKSTGQLAAAIRPVAGRRGRIDPATRSFQALRLEVNQELTELATGLPLLVELLSAGGRLAVISFHSLEDRLVKQFFASASRDCICPPGQPVCTCNHRASVRLVNRKAVKGEINDASNPRARSARLRVIEKLTAKPKEAK